MTFPPAWIGASRMISKKRAMSTTNPPPETFINDSEPRDFTNNQNNTMNRNILSTILTVASSVQAVGTLAASPTEDKKPGQHGKGVTWISSTAEKPWQQ